WCVAEWPIERPRDVLDAYFTSYFNAWLDNHNLYTGPKRIVTAFAPRLAMKHSSVARLFADYPDGCLISIVREPRSWYASIRGHVGYSDVDNALGRWRMSAEATLDAARLYGEPVLVVTYEQLALETEATVVRRAQRLRITTLPLP